MEKKQASSYQPKNTQQKTAKTNKKKKKRAQMICKLISGQTLLNFRIEREGWDVKLSLSFYQEEFMYEFPHPSHLVLQDSCYCPFCL